MCGCTGQIGNCNCNDCSLITVPQVIGPQGPAGPTGPQGPQGDPGFMVVEAEVTFTGNTPVGALVAYQDGYLVDVTNIFNTDKDKLHIQAGFTIVADDLTPCTAGVAVNSAVDIIGQVPLAQYGDGVNDSISVGTKILTLEFDLVRINATTYRVFGYSLVTSGVSGSAIVGPNVYDSKYFQGTIIGAVSDSKFGSNFYVYLYAVDPAINPELLTITPNYFSVEFKKHA